MKSIKSRILIPFILVLAITPAVTLGVLNVLIRSYINNGIVTQLENTVTTTQILIKTELSDTIYETDPEKIDQTLSNLNRILRTSKIALNTELLLFKESGEMIYPVEYNNTFLENGLISAIRADLATLSPDKNRKINVGGREFIVMGYKLSQLPIANIPYVVFVSSMDKANPLFSTTNLVLLLVMILGIGIGVFFAYRIANRVSKPIQELCEAAVRIGDRKAFTLEHQTDIREINQLKESIIMMSNRIDIYDKAQKAFLQNASHELKTPLMSIQGYAEGIENGLLPDVKKAGTIIREESIKLNSLLTELLVLSRIENHNYDQHLEKAVLNEVIKEVLQRLEGIAFKEKKQLIFKESENPLEVAYNESLFNQCFMNVVSNAIRYASGSIIISVSKDSGNARIDVTDDGAGLEEKDIPHLFERFYKGESGQFGLGLAIAKSAVEAMKGTIMAQNTQNGAKFSITLPLWTC